MAYQGHYPWPRSMINTKYFHSNLKHLKQLQTIPTNTRKNILHLNSRKFTSRTICDHVACICISRNQTSTLYSRPYQISLLDPTSILSSVMLPSTANKTQENTNPDEKSSFPSYKAICFIQTHQTFQQLTKTLHYWAGNYLMVVTTKPHIDTYSHLSTQYRKWRRNAGRIHHQDTSHLHLNACFTKLNK